MKSLKVLSFAGLFSVFACSYLLAQPTKESLVEAWEQVQRNLPGVEVFEKSSESRYKFKTTIFPYEGEIKVLNAAVRDWDDHLSNEGIVSLGVIELELTNFGQDLQAKYSYSYYNWAEHNMLYFNKKQNRWITAIEYRKQIDNDTKSQQNYFTILLQYLPYGLLFILAYFVIVTIKNNKVVKQTVRMSEDAIKLSKEGVRISEESLNINKEGLKIAEESKNLLKEANILLEKISNELNK